MSSAIECSPARVLSLLLRLHTAIRLPESDENRASRPFQIVVTVFAVRLNFQLASNSWIGSNQNTISYVRTSCEPLLWRFYLRAPNLKRLLS
eukprot:scaffold2625_cov114-Skeletonema_marinoi.AAC.2